MKKTITTLAFALSMLAASAQEVASSGQCASRPTPDAKLLSTSIDGGYKVCKWLVPKRGEDDMNSEFSVRYQVNIAKMISTYDNNSTEVAGLRNFVNEVMADKEKNISRINICGYASPDGNATANKRLAMTRAVDCRKFINEEFNLSKYPGKTDGLAQPWSAAVDAINQSTMPNKSKVLSIVKSSEQATMIESNLKEIPQSWGYMIRNILPPMRRVEIEMVYTGWSVVETRTPIPEEIVEDVVVEQNNYYVIFTERPSDYYTFTNPLAAPLDFRKCKDSRRDDNRGKFIFKNNRRKEKIKGDKHSLFGRDRDKERVWFR